MSISAPRNLVGEQGHVVELIYEVMRESFQTYNKKRYALCNS